MQIVPSESTAKDVKTESIRNLSNFSVDKNLVPLIILGHAALRFITLFKGYP